MNRKASIAAQLTADRSKWTSDLSKAAAEGRKFVSDMGSLRGQPGFFKGMGDTLGKVIGKYQHLRAAVTDVAALAVRAAGAPAMYNDMTDALTAVTGSAAEAKSALDFLAGVAEEQKLEFEPLVEAYQRMRALGYSAEQTRDFIREMGNAIEASGGGSEDLTGVVNALSKITDKGEAAAKQLMQMGEALPALRAIFKEQFGSETAADIDKLNLSSKELFEGILRGLKKIETQKGGVLDAASPEYLASMARLRTGRAGTGNNPLIPDLPDRVVSGEDPAAAAARVAELQARAAEEKQAAGEAELERMDNVAGLEGELAEARAKGDEEKIAALEDELALMSELADLVKKTGVDEKTATDYLLRRNQARRDEAAALKEIEAIKDREEKSKTAGKAAYDTAEDIAITEARARGKEKRAKKLEREKGRRQQEESLIADGMDPAQARAMAERGSQAQEDLEYFQEHGRRRVRTTGTTSRIKGAGLGGGLGRGGGFLTPSALDTNDPDRAAAAERAAGGNTARGSASANDRVEALLTDIKTALLNNKPSVGEKTKPRT